MNLNPVGFHSLPLFSLLRKGFLKSLRSNPGHAIGKWLKLPMSGYNLYQLIEDEWDIYASLNWVIIGSDNGLLPRRQAIIWTNTGILLIGSLGTNFVEILIRNSDIFIQQIAFENVVCKMASFSSRPQRVNHQKVYRQLQGWFMLGNVVTWAKYSLTVGTECSFRV